MAFAGKYSITIDHNQCGASDSANFPMVLLGSFTYLKSTANGGQVANANAYDINFFSDSGLTTKLAWELVNWSASTGAVEIHVKIPTLSHSADTVIYMGVGDSGISAFQGGSTGAAWDSNFALVYHFGDGSVLSTNDSTANGNNGTNHSALAASGQVFGGAQTGVTNTSGYIDTPLTDLTFGGANAGTLEIWAKPEGNPASGSGQQLFGQLGGGSEFVGWLTFSDGNFYWGWDGGSDYRVVLAGSTSNATNNVWQKYTLVWSQGTQAKLYRNNTLLATASSNTVVANTGVALRLGWQNPTSFAAWNGYIDEVRISKTVRSADYITASYNNQNAPSSFFTIATLTPPPPANTNTPTLLLMGVG